ncbi:DnaJ C-terminal domain-containing protein [Pseudomonadota bacterium]
MTDPYRLLGLKRTASADDVKKSYRRLAREHHPDRRPGDPAAENRFKDISNAYSLLSDPTKRRQFDAGEIDVQGNRTAKSPGSGSHGYSAYRNNSAGPKTRHKTAGAKPGGPKKSRFNGFFRERAMLKTKGADVSYTLKVSVLDAADGADKTVRMTSGKTLKVRIPPGTESGQVLRLKNQGMDGLGGGKSGDALVEILVEADTDFKTEGLDVHSEEPVTLAEAMLGGRIEVQTSHGPVMVTVPENSNTGTKLRLKGRGMHRPGSSTRGDHYVTLKVVLPKGNDEELKKFVKKWSAKHPYSVRTETLKRTAAE